MGPDIIEWTVSPQRCPELPNGMISIDSIVGGTKPFFIQIDNGPPDMFFNTPYTFDGLATGNHYISVTDAIGCAQGVLINVYSWNIGAIDLGPDHTIQKGDSVLIQPTVEGVDVLSVTWNPPLPNQGLEDFWFRPEVTTLLSVVVEDTFGCIYADEVLIRVYEEESFYIPNIFSPNNDGINDVFEVVTNLPPEQLLSLEIFDRWGSMVYGQYGITPYQWDGLSNGKKVQSGVYVYKFSWKDANGDTRIELGDVTVFR